MRVSEAMTPGVRLAGPDQTIREAAAIMAEIDAGVLPVGEGDCLVGMLTDRDIAIRAVAQGKGPDTPVREVMSREARCCYEDEELEQVARNMAGNQLRRMPVLSRDMRLVGILSLGDVAVAQGPGAAGEALGGISQPGGEHSQTGGPRL